MRKENHQNLGFASAVQDYFMQKTGRCLVLSSRDTELLLGWEDTGASVATICHGIDSALGNAKRPPRDLYACKKFVEERIRSAVGEVRKKPSGFEAQTNREPRVQAPVERTDTRIERALHKLEHAYERAELDYLKDAYQHAITHCRSLEDTALLDDLDQKLITDVAASLPSSEIESANQKVQQAYGPQLSKMSPAASQSTFIAKRNDLLRETLGIVTLFE